jgi:hypothetical protein
VVEPVETYREPALRVEILSKPAHTATVRKVVEPLAPTFSVGESGIEGLLNDWAAVV